MNATGQIPPHRQPQPRTQQCSGQCGDCTTVHTHMAARQPGQVVATPAGQTLLKAGPYPWDDITALEDEIENDLGTAALRLLVSYACIAVVSFTLGLFVGQL